MIAERVQSHTTHFRIFSRRIILRYETLGLVSRGLVQRTLTSDCGAARGFGAASGCCQITPVPAFNAAHFGSALALSQGAAQSLFKRLQRRRLLARDAISLRANLAR
jgi:hypothetical protein